jgi:hypothetical protein
MEYFEPDLENPYPAGMAVSGAMRGFRNGRG